jgi:2-methylisocitrate lyase-like PEP mutase family enzyme
MNQKLLIEKAEALRALHVPGKPIVLFNAWDPGTAKLIAAEGFPAVATTSAGIAFSRGYPDGQVISRDEMLEAIRGIASAVEVPVTADIEAGYGTSSDAVARAVGLTLEAGAVGANLEDSAPTADRAHALVDFALAIERVAAARRASDQLGIPFVLNARTDAFFGVKDQEAAFTEAVRRGNAYLEAGARSVFVPFVVDAKIIARLAKAISGPLNVLIGPGATIGELAELGVARVSFGSTPTRAAFGFLRQAAREVREKGTQEFAGVAIPHPELNAFFAPKK